MWPIADRARPPRVPGRGWRPGWRLRQVFVGRAQHDFFDRLVVFETPDRAGKRIIGFKFDHGPDDHPQRGDGLLGQRELAQQVWVDAGAGLIAGEETVAERLDDVVE